MQDSHLYFVTENLGVVAEEKFQRFHQDIFLMVKRSQTKIESKNGALTVMYPKPNTSENHNKLI